MSGSSTAITQIDVNRETRGQSMHGNPNIIKLITLGWDKTRSVSNGRPYHFDSLKPHLIRRKRLTYP